MAIKGGSIVHVGNGLAVIDRLQTAGPGQLNIPTEKIYELGNYQSVATVRDVPDLQFSMESYDVSTEVEALITRQYAGRNLTAVAMTDGDETLTATGANFAAADVGRMVIVPGAGVNGGELVTTVVTVTNATTVELADAAEADVTGGTGRITQNGYDLGTAAPVDFASQWKAGRDAQNPFVVESSVALPFLQLEQMSYRFGLSDNATQQAQFRGDTIFYSAGSTYVQEVPGTNVAGQVLVTAQPAYGSAGGDGRRVLAVTAGTRRLTRGVDYTESVGPVTAGAAVVTVTLKDPVPATEVARLIYASPTAASYPQSVHPDATVRPAAIKGKRDVEIYVGGYDPNDREGSRANFLGSVQSVTVEWRVTLERDEEFGNEFAVATDFDVPATTGTVDVKPPSPAAFMALLRRLTNVADPTLSIGPNSSAALPLDIVMKHPDTGQVLKRLHVDDARFTVPGYQGQVQQKMTVSVPYESDSGTLVVFER